MNFQHAAHATRRALGERTSSRSSAATSSRDFDNRGFGAEARGFITDAFTLQQPRRRHAAQSSPPPVSYRRGEPARLVLLARELRLPQQVLPHRRAAPRRLVAPRPPGNKWAMFPAVSASWRLSEEAFMQGRPVLRPAPRAPAAGGRATRRCAPYATQLLLAPNNGARYPFGEHGRSRASSPTAGREPATSSGRQSAQTNVGLDYGVREQPLHRHARVLPEEHEGPAARRCRCRSRPSSSTRLENIGSVRNRGFEATLDAQLFDAASSTLSLGPRASASSATRCVSLGEPRSSSSPAA